MSFGTPQAKPRRRRRVERIATLGAFFFALIALSFDLTNLLRGAIAGLYIIVVLLVAQIRNQRALILTGVVCAILMAMTFMIVPHSEPRWKQYSRLAVNLTAIAIATTLSVRTQRDRSSLRDMGSILELTHDTVVTCDERGVIQYWNEGAERLYGWRAQEAIGQNCDELLRTRAPFAEIEAALEQTRQWSGELVRQRRDGTSLVLASRRLARLDGDGFRIGVAETSQDLTEMRLAEAERDAFEQRYSHIFHRAGVAIWESDWGAARATLADAVPPGGDPRLYLPAHPELVSRAAALATIRDCNRAAAALFDAKGPDALKGATILSLYEASGIPVLGRMTAALLAGDGQVEAETQLVTLTGRTVDVLLRANLIPGGEDWTRILVMALDFTERNEMRARLEQASAELTHAARVSMLGQLTASIAHEVNQPLAAIRNYGQSGLRWLRRSEPNVDEASAALERITSNAARASEVIARVRSLVRKGPPNLEALDLAPVIGEALSLVERDARRNSVSLQWSPPLDLPPVLADRIQVQQVLVNLLLNGIQATSGVSGRERELRVTAQPDEPGFLRVSVRDSGRGFADPAPEAMFEPFFTTKPDGMGLGLSISRSIIEAQGGRIGGANNPDHGATVSFWLPCVTAQNAPGGDDPAGGALSSPA